MKVAQIKGPPAAVEINAREQVALDEDSYHT